MPKDDATRRSPFPKLVKAKAKVASSHLEAPSPSLVDADRITNTYNDRIKLEAITLSCECGSACLVTEGIEKNYLGHFNDITELLFWLDKSHAEP